MTDDADEYEEVLVYAELSGLVESGELFWKNAPNHVGILGLGEDQPLIQIGETTFRGSYEDSVGSLMFFEGHEGPSASAIGGLSTAPPLLTAATALGTAPASAASDKTSYKYACHTDKVLPMKRIFLQPKGPRDDGGPSKDDSLGAPPTSAGTGGAADDDIMEMDVDMSATAAGGGQAVTGNQSTADGQPEPTADISTEAGEDQT